MFIYLNSSLGFFFLFSFEICILYPHTSRCTSAVLQIRYAEEEKNPDPTLDWKKIGIRIRPSVHLNCAWIWLQLKKYNLFIFPDIYLYFLKVKIFWTFFLWSGSASLSLWQYIHIYIIYIYIYISLTHFLALFLSRK